MMSMGFLAELITAYQGRDEDSYSIADRTPAHSHEHLRQRRLVCSCLITRC